MSTPVLAQRLADVGLDVRSMGGRLRLRVACAPGQQAQARRDLGSLATRVQRWAARLTRFEAGSELSALNADPEAPTTPVGPTLGAVLSWATEARRRSRGVVDVTMLDARLAAEAGTPWTRSEPTAGRALHRQDGWPLERRDRWELRSPGGGRHACVMREGRVRFDLDGVAKGWIADRALAHLGGYPAALVDADGDIAIRVDERTGWVVDVDDPDRPARALASIALERVGSVALGVATSGIDVHRWGDDPGRHHLIDPATGRPARSDVRQCTVVAVSAALAEVVAKAVLIRGSAAGAELVGRSGVLGAVLLHRSGEVMATEQVLTWLV